MPAVSSKATAFVTGATGYVATQIIHDFLDAGFTVVGTVRSAEGGEYLSKLFSERFSFVIVEDLAAPGALTPFVHLADLIVHVANPTRFPERPYDPQLMIQPAIDATINVLESATAVGSRVQRVVITGSIASITNIEGHDGPHEFTETEWNDWATHEVKTRGSDASDLAIYSVGKQLSEKAAMAFVAEKNPPFDVVHILPYFVYGPVMRNIRGIEALTGSLRMVWEILAYPDGRELSEYHGGFVDVRDVARAHIDAATRQDLSGARILCTSQHCFVVQDFYDAYYAIPEPERPKFKHDIPRGIPGLGDSIRGTLPTFSRASQAKLCWELRGLTECLRDMLQSYQNKGFF